MVRGGLLERVTFEWAPELSERVDHVDIMRRACRERECQGCCDRPGNVSWVKKGLKVGRSILSGI